MYFILRLVVRSLLDEQITLRGGVYDKGLSRRFRAERYAKTANCPTSICLMNILSFRQISLPYHTIIGYSFQVFSMGL